MYSKMKLPGFEDTKILKMEETDGAYHIHVQLPKKAHKCPDCGGRQRESMITAPKRSSI
ncbi:hypothetical protein [Virgibacillus sediminis]|uniref:ISL3 family transposase n=1 Tax=Virgibacillus sediminis TaxID=202260 RepID=A0ABV7A3D6_9BACI